MAEKTVKIKHGLFYYHEPVMRIVGGEEKSVLVERLAFHGEEVTLTRDADIERGNEVGAFFTDEELKQMEEASAPPSPDENPEETTRDPKELDDEDLVDWLMGTGEFDGHKKPTAAEVVDAIGDDAEFGERVLDAEETASGGNPRKAVVEHVESLTEE